MTIADRQPGSCPVCSKSARAVVTGGGYTRFNCPSCGEFYVSAGMMANLAREPQARWIKKLSDAKRRATVDGLPMIKSD